MNTALLLLEIQNDYFPQGRIPLDKSVEACNKTKIVLEAHREHKLPVIHMQQFSTHPNAAHHLPCTKGAEFHDNVAPMKGEAVIKKHYPNSFKDTALLNYLKKNSINHLTICGMMTHLAVDATVRAAYDLGFSCTVIHDACAARQLEFGHMLIPSQNVHYAFLAALNPLYANLLSTDDIIERAGMRIAAAS